MILSDATIREYLADGQITIDPLADSAIQPSSVDVCLDHRFLVFKNHTRGLIDVKEDLSDLTEGVEASDADPFICLLYTSPSPRDRG